MNEDELILEIASRADQYISDLCNEFKIHPLSLSAVFMARLGLLCKSIGEAEEYLALLRHSIETIKNDSGDRVRH